MFKTVNFTDPLNFLLPNKKIEAPTPSQQLPLEIWQLALEYLEKKDLGSSSMVHREFTPLCKQISLAHAYPEVIVNALGIIRFAELPNITLETPPCTNLISDEEAESIKNAMGDHPIVIGKYDKGRPFICIRYVYNKPGEPSKDALLVLHRYKNDPDNPHWRCCDTQHNLQTEVDDHIDFDSAGNYFYPGWINYKGEEIKNFLNHLLTGHPCGIVQQFGRKVRDSDPLFYEGEKVLPRISLWNPPLIPSVVSETTKNSLLDRIINTCPLF